MLLMFIQSLKKSPKSSPAKKSWVLKTLRKNIYHRNLRNFVLPNLRPFHLRWQITSASCCHADRTSPSSSDRLELRKLLEVNIKESIIFVKTYVPYSAISLNRSLEPSSLFRSGWYFYAILAKAFLISFLSESLGIPNISCRLGKPFYGNNPS